MRVPSDGIRTLISGVLTAAVVAVAYAAGRQFQDHLIEPAAFLGAGMSLAGMAHPHRGERLPSMFLLAWLFWAATIEPFAWAGSLLGASISLFFLVPPIAGGVYLPRSGRVWTGVACWFLVFASVAATASSSNRVHSGVGLFMRWIS